MWDEAVEKCRMGRETLAGQGTKAHIKQTVALLDARVQHIRKPGRRVALPVLLHATMGR